MIAGRRHLGCLDLPMSSTSTQTDTSSKAFISRDVSRFADAQAASGQYLPSVAFPSCCAIHAQHALRPVLVIQRPRLRI